MSSHIEIMIVKYFNIFLTSGFYILITNFMCSFTEYIKTCRNIISRFKLYFQTQLQKLYNQFICSKIKSEEGVKRSVMYFGIVTPRQGLLIIKLVITTCFKEECNMLQLFYKII